MTNIVEQFVNLDEYPGYFISSLGRVIGLRNEFLKPSKNEKGYLVVRIKNKNGKAQTVRVHRLVAMAFIPNPHHYLEVNHIDGNKQNNNVNNLEWCTRNQNIAHAMRTGLSPLKYGFSNPYSVLTKEQVEYIRNHYIARDKEFGCRALAKKFKVHHKTIADVINNKRYIINGAFNSVQKTVVYEHDDAEQLTS